jgi:exo-1,4-beta-D-glucosaminidase
MVALTAILAPGGCRTAPEEPVGGLRPLSTVWYVQDARQVAAGGDQLSQAFEITGWYPTTVPRTVLAALVEAGEYPDPYFARNLESIPRDRFRAPWWYRTTFRLTPQEVESHPRLQLAGVNYQAEVWLNGSKIAGTDRLAGAFRRFDLDIRQAVRAGENHLAILVHPPQPGDFTIGFVDWNPPPPDENMGLWRGVFLRLSGGVSLEDPFVRTKVNLQTLEEAWIEPAVELVNRDADPVEAEIEVAFGGRSWTGRVSVLPGQPVLWRLTSHEFPALHVEKPALWWPQTLGEPNLHELEFTVRLDGVVSDRRRVRFGIREVADYLTPQGHRGYKVNGREVLIRGGGWVDDLLLADTSQRVRAQLEYVRLMNLNTVRLEGFWGNDETLYDTADELGILLMAGWSCQWEWENYLGQPVDDFGGIDTPEEMELVVRSLEDQVRWLRHHPSIFVWVTGSDKLPRPGLEENYLQMLRRVDGTRPVLAACSWRTSEVSGPTAVKMNGPYDYVPPVYWYEDRTHGGAFGFNTETGPGPQPPPIDSLRRMLPQEHLWPIDDMWQYHCGRNEFNTLDRYFEALRHRYGEPQGVEEFTRWAQVANYEAMRAMFEAFAARRPEATGVIQWMLNSAWPEMYWQLYDWYLMPNGAFFGAQQACQPMTALYDYSRHEIVAYNDTLEDRAGWKVEMVLLGTDSQVRHQESRPVDLPAGRPRVVMTVPASRESGGHFLLLRLLDGAGAEQARNFYWLASTEDAMDYAASQWFVTPIRRFADLRWLRELDTAAVAVEAAPLVRESGMSRTVVRLKNTTEHLAFFVELKLVSSVGDAPVLPVYWRENYMSLLPGEIRQVGVRFPETALGGGRPVVLVSGPNIPAMRVEVP